MGIFSPAESRPLLELKSFPGHRLERAGERGEGFFFVTPVPDGGHRIVWVRHSLRPLCPPREGPINGCFLVRARALGTCSSLPLGATVRKLGRSFIRGERRYKKTCILNGTHVRLRQTVQAWSVQTDSPSLCLSVLLPRRLENTRALEAIAMLELQPGDRPVLRPLWASYHATEGPPDSIPRPTAGSASSLSPMIPRSLPSPLYPPPVAYDATMAKHERAMLERLSQGRGRPFQEPTHLLPTEGQTMLAARLGNMTVNSPPSRPPAPAAPPPCHGRRPSMASEARSLLLSGLPRSGASDLAAAVPRRQSVPGPDTHRSLRRGHHLLQQLHAQGRAHLGNARSADIFVVAVALRLPGYGAGASAAAAAGGQDVTAGRGPDTSSSSSSPPPPPSQLTVRARVRPRAPDREPFVIQRTFELEALRSTALAPLAAAAVVPAARRQSADAAARTHLPSVLRRPSATSGAAAGGLPLGPGLPSGSSPDPSRGGLRTADAVPLRECTPSRVTIPPVMPLLRRGAAR